MNISLVDGHDHAQIIRSLGIGTIALIWFVM